jgi:hypothetical protein
MMVRHMTRSLFLMLAIAIATSPLTPALADDAKEKAAIVNAEPAPQPKIRVILPAMWEPAAPQGASQAASQQRSAAR